MSKEKEELKKLVEGVSNDLLIDKHTQEMGQKAVVERRTLVNNERTDQLRQVIRDVAADMQNSGLVTKGLEYRGSLTVHVFASDLLRVTEFAPLTVIDKLPGVLADSAVHALRNSVLADYGRRMQKKRSGF